MTEDSSEVNIKVNILYLTEKVVKSKQENIHSVFYKTR